MRSCSLETDLMGDVTVPLYCRWHVVGILQVVEPSWNVCALVAAV